MAKRRWPTTLYTIGQRFMAGLVWFCALSAPAKAQWFPHAIDYAAQWQSSFQYNSNPGRVSDARPPHSSSNILTNTAGLAARIPVLSKDTYLDVVGVGGTARYKRQTQLNHKPHYLDTTFHWRAGRLFAGRLGHFQQNKRYDSDWLWPLADTVKTRRTWAEMQFRPSESLSLPLIRAFHEKTNYGLIENQQLFRRTTKGWLLAGHYQSVTGSSLRLGLETSRSRFPLRHLVGRSDLDDEYTDREVFTEVFWNYSVKTSFYGHFGWLRRKYHRISERDTRLPVINTNVLWHHSPKTSVRLGLWNRPYSNDEDPNIIYTKVRGGGFTINWKITSKTEFRLRGLYEKQHDVTLSGRQVPARRMQIGPRLSWQASPNLKVFLESYHDRKRGSSASNHYSQNVVRVGIILYTDSGNADVNALFSPDECRWMYLETELCR